jgi:acetylornithine deacetylase/succinyl-diaminopimelate desuccinylase-like protein
MYEVSEKIQSKLDRIVGEQSVKNALQYMEDDHQNIIDKQIELTLIPAPTGQEEKKAKRLLEMFRSEGLVDCYIDEIGNAIGTRPGSGGGKTLVIEAHMDTVFPIDTKLEIKYEDGYIKCPGIIDNSRGCAVLVSVIRAMNAAGIKTKGDIQFVGTVREEGFGGFGGMRHYCNTHPETEVAISVDGPSITTVTYLETGLYTYEFIFHGKGGHARDGFGNTAHCLHALGRAIAKIGDIEDPDEPRTTYAVTTCNAGSYEAIHGIPPEAKMTINFRSDRQKELDELKDKIFAAIEEACREETERWPDADNEITFSANCISEAKAIGQDIHSPMVEATVATARFLGAEPRLADGGCTNLCRSLEAGLPAICLGIGTDYPNMCHDLGECFLPDGTYTGPQQTFLMALLTAGCAWADSIID